ncbi:MAG: hypothetical protein A2843_02355 [Candidatus Wildermuthbacteria bacterium RIFCSPHIGHO2_01_FULL_48_27b]|uniref:Transcriptional repressor PaaX-like central Cas2-like domain-containing protein n=1 Tax=Candidatus Wildermuthbacteria bacterium RIFCSPHIGHO2_01_FULL_48_27b TaxID=1802447 RepID=A0A1G2QTB0_9BACT|nr:MAG: hypothetical protein A2843_02355 [Candidatus Wildermuthbacteria bacterium RIFCSPHIGHO2_01_FULL_48_27b]
MRLPITDKFLWDLYNAIDKVERVYSSVSPPRSVRQYVYRDVIRLRKEYERRKNRRSFSQFIHYLQTKGYIKIKALGGTKGLVLTPKGAEKVLRVRRKMLKRKKRKDGRWIMIVFDVPEKKRVLRQILRATLVDMGYEKFQQSVWVCPYDVFEETEKIIREYHLIPFVKLFLIEESTQS